MSQHHYSLVLKQLYDAFALVEKPDPLTTYEGSYWDEEVDVFNNLDWESASYSDFADGNEGAIICPAITKLYLLPRLFRMVFLRRSGEYEDAVDNLTEELRSWPIDDAVEPLLSEGQKSAIIDAWNYMEFCIYNDTGIPTAQEFSNRWGIPR